MSRKNPISTSAPKYGPAVPMPVRKNIFDPLGLIQFYEDRKKHPTVGLEEEHQSFLRKLHFLKERRRKWSIICPGAYPSGGKQVYNYLWNLEHVNIFPDWHMVLKLCRYFMVDLEEFFDWDCYHNYKYSMPPDKVKFMELISTLEETQLKQVGRFMEDLVRKRRKIK